MPRARKAQDSQLARLALRLGEKLYELADDYWITKTGHHISSDLDCYPEHARAELKTLDDEKRASVLKGRRGDGAVFYLNCCCLRDRLTLDTHDYTFRRYVKQGVFGDAMDKERYVSTIRKLVQIYLRNPYTDPLMLGEQLRDWTRSDDSLLPQDDARYEAVPDTVGRLAADGRCGEYLYLLAVGDLDAASEIANNEGAAMSPWERVEAEARSVEWLWHENDFDGALDRSYKLWLVNTLDVEGWECADELVTRLLLLKEFADVLDSILVRGLALSVYCSALRAALSLLSLPSALMVGASYTRLRAVAAAIANALSVCLIHLGRKKDADVASMWSLTERKLLYKPQGGQALVGPEELAKTLNNRGVCLDLQSRYDESLPHLQEALDIRDRMYCEGASQGDHYCAMSHNAIGEHHFRVAMTFLKRGDMTSARQAYEEALTEHEKARIIRVRRKDDGRWAPRYAASLHNMAGCHIGITSCIDPDSHAAAEHLAIAKRLLEEALEIRVECFKSYPHIYFGGVRNTYGRLEEISGKMGRLDHPKIRIDEMEQKADEGLMHATQKAKKILDGLGLPTEERDIERLAGQVLHTISGMTQPS